MELTSWRLARCRSEVFWITVYKPLFLDSNVLVRSELLGCRIFCLCDVQNIAVNSNILNIAVLTH